MPVQLALGLQLLRGAGGLDPAIVQDNHAIAASNRRQPVREEDHGAISGEPGDGIIDERLDRLVERDRRFLDDQNRRIMQPGSGQSDPVLLVESQVMPERTDEGVIPLRQVLDNVVCMRVLGSFDDPREVVARIAPGRC